MQQPTGTTGRRQTAVITCPKSMVGRVIGRNGETIKALQTYTGALIQIDQTCDPTKIAISGTPQSLNLALSMVHDIVRGTFKGFALLRQATGHSSRGSHQLSTKPVYAPGYGLIPPSQLYGGEAAAAMVHPAAGGVMAPRAPGAPGATYPQLLSAGPLAAAPPQFVLGVQPVPVAGAALHTPVYNVISSPAFTGPVYLSPIEYSGAPQAAGGQLAHMGAGAGGMMAAGGSPADVVLYSDGTSLLSGGTGSRFFQTVGGVNRGPTASAAGGGDGGMLGSQSLGGGVAYGSAAGGTHGHRGAGGAGGSGAGGGGAGGLLQHGSLVMDAEGSLYTYTMDA